MTRPNIKRAEDLRGKRFAITSIGPTTWMGVLLWLEQLGLDEQRDKIQMQVVGDQAIQAQAIETGLCDAAVLDGAFSRKLKQKGMNILAEYTEMTKLLAGQSMVVHRSFLQQHGDLSENYLKAEIEGLAFSLSPKNKPVVLRAMMKYLRTDAAGAEDGYLDLIRGVDRPKWATSKWKMSSMAGSRANSTAAVSLKKHSRRTALVSNNREARCRQP